MTRAELFPDAHRDTQAERLEAAWDLDWPLPIPRFVRWCPACSSGNPFPEESLVLKDWKFHKRDKTGSSHPWRCDVRLKCVACSLVLIYGVVIPEAMYLAATAKRRTATTSWISWREGKAQLEAAGFFREE